jgi:hypothetical protein
MKCKKFGKGVLAFFASLFALTFYVILILVSILTLKDSIQHWKRYHDCDPTAAYLLLISSLLPFVTCLL